MQQNEGSKFARINDNAVPFSRETKHAMVLIFNQKKTTEREHNENYFHQMKAKQPSIFVVLNNRMSFHGARGGFISIMGFCSQFYFKLILSLLKTNAVFCKLMKSKNEYTNGNLSGKKQA